MTIRGATEADHDTIRELWTAFADEMAGPPFLRETWESAWSDLRRHIADGIALVAEQDGRPVGFVFARLEKSLPDLAHVTDLYVVPDSRRQGVSKTLLREVAAELERRGVRHIGLDVASHNAGAQAVYDRLGFVEYERFLATSVEELSRRLTSERAEKRSFGSVHVQSDDVPAVERAVREFVPRLPGRSRASVVANPRRGWTAVYDELCDREPEMLRRLAREISHRMGAVVLTLGVEAGAVVRYVLFDRGRVVDEYLSVPEYYGPLPPGDVVALAANATVVARLTGADQTAVRAAARTGATPAQLAPPSEQLAALADALGIRGGEHGFADSGAPQDTIMIEHA